MSVASSVLPLNQGGFWGGTAGKDGRYSYGNLLLQMRNEVRDRVLALATTHQMGLSLATLQSHAHTHGVYYAL